MEKANHMLAELDLGMFGWVTLNARLLPTGLLGQFVSAGGALFSDSGFEGLHTAFGGILSLPAALLLSGAVLASRLRRFCI